MIHLYTGNGKGKTSAAIGLAVRAAGRGQRICFSQFMKGSDSGELYAMRCLPQIEILRSEKDYGFYSSMSEQDKKELTEVHNRILRALLLAAEEGRCHVIVLDESSYPVNWGLLDISLLKNLLSFADRIEIVLTGRDPADFLTECADYLTEMQNRRHPYEKGTRARKGIEF